MGSYLVTMRVVTTLSLLFGLVWSQEDTRVINTHSGPVRGKKVTKDDHHHYEFLGIPYAEPPLGKLRFKPPEPVKPWTDVFEAFSDGPVCYQAADLPGALAGNDNSSEDCLTLNVFTPSSLEDSEPLPVMVWIHGGGFTLGSKDLYRMSAIVNEDVILVAMNYRLHALGFLSFGNKLVSGNMGLRDQHLALQWVSANIDKFGGDPGRVTIFGESVGDISVQAQVLSPLNSGLLYAAIAQSGSILYLNNEYKKGTEVRFAENAAAAFGCPTTLDEATLECMQRVDARTMNEKIQDSDENTYNPAYTANFSYWPVVDHYAEDPFLPLDPLEAIMTGMFNRIPYMTGTVEYEGSLVPPLSGVSGNEAAYTILVPPKTSFNLNYGQDQTFNEVALQFYNHTSGESSFEQELPAIHFGTDTWFLSYDQKSAEWMSEHMKHVYNYVFTQKTNNSALATIFGLDISYTPVHGDDEVFLIDQDKDKFSAEELDAADHMVSYWTNFAKHGAPSPVSLQENDIRPTWFPYTKESKNYLDLSAKPKMRQDLALERMFFWDKMLWAERQQEVELRLIYKKTSQ